MHKAGAQDFFRKILNSFIQMGLKDRIRFFHDCLQKIES